jgi:O-methyltransferase involved in polyketide biosynthesis
MIFTAIRVRKFDQMCKTFLSQFPNGIIISLGAGIDNRFSRIDNGTLTFVELDFPEVIEFKKMLVTNPPRNMLIGKSVLDYSWITQVEALQKNLNSPIFVIAEGLMPYLEKVEMRELLQKIGQAFPGSELFFDVCWEKVVKFMTKHSGIDEFNVQLKSGLQSGHEVEAWGIGFKLIDIWYYSDDPDAKHGLLKLIMLNPIVKRTFFFLHGKMEK